MNNYSVNIEIKEDNCSNWTVEQRKVDFMKENIEEIDVDGNVTKCWYIILNGVHISGDYISFSSGMTSIEKGGKYGENVATINNDDIKSLSFRVDDNEFKIYNFKF